MNYRKCVASCMNNHSFDNFTFSMAFGYIFIDLEKVTFYILKQISFKGVQSKDYNFLYRNSL